MHNLDEALKLHKSNFKGSDSVGKPSKSDVHTSGKSLNPRSLYLAHWPLEYVAVTFSVYFKHILVSNMLVISHASPLRNDRTALVICEHWFMQWDRAVSQQAITQTNVLSQMVMEHSELKWQYWGNLINSPRVELIVEMPVKSSSEWSFLIFNSAIIISLSGVPDFFDRNKILSGGDLSHYQVPHCIRVFFYFVWFAFIHHNFKFYFELCT